MYAIRSYYEKHEQVEDVAGQEGAVDPHQLEHEQRMEVHAAAVVAGAGIEHGAEAEEGGQQQHQRGQTVDQQLDAELV